MLKIVAGFEKGEERRGNLKIGDIYVMIDRGVRPEEDQERMMRWNGDRAEHPNASIFRDFARSTPFVSVDDAECRAFGRAGDIV